MVVKEFLDTDRVNFLVWRYLLESNYRETALKLQKEWQVGAPHRDLPFAQHVKGHALISVINRGMLYYAHERDYARDQLPQDADAAEAEALQVGVFGPLDSRPTGRVVEEGNDAEPTEANEVSRKRSQTLPNGSSPKRPRLSNGYDNSTAPDAAATGTTPMDVDQSSQPLDNHAYPSPLEGERAPTPAVRTDGPEQGTQVDKVEELTTDTTFIRLTDETESSPSPSPSTLDSAPILLQCEWNPKDPSVLAAAGTDALARVWTVSRATVPESGQGHVPPHTRTLVDPETPRSTTVTALAWTSDGDSIAVATAGASQDSGASVAVWSRDGAQLQSYEVSEAPVFKLYWNPSSSALLAISPYLRGALVTVYSSASTVPKTYHLADHDIDAAPLDATWISDAEFLLCGGDVLLSLHCTETSIVQSKKFETRDDDTFRQVLFDGRSKLAATSSEKGILDLWDETGQRRSISAHQGAITTMAWQPLAPSQATPEDERLIATGGDDCAILIWNARVPESKAKCFLTMDSPIVRLAFSPDGAFIAGATSSQVLIWKMGNHAMPRASWTRPPHPGWLSPRTGSETEDEDEHCLGWDASGQKLAYGSNSRLAVINFTR